jgi:putative NADPH-quinone reductase
MCYEYGGINLVLIDREVNISYRISSTYSPAVYNVCMVLVLHAHPDTESFTAFIATETARALESSGVTVQSADLYRLENGPFPPLADTEELRRKTSLDPMVQQQMALVEEADSYMIVHPDWWGGPPAVLKGWLDRVLRPGTAYEYPESFDEREAVGLLKGHRAMVVVTGDSDGPGPLEEFWMDRVWSFCGAESRFRYFARVKDSHLNERKRFVRKTVEEALGFLGRIG